MGIAIQMTKAFFDSKNLRYTEMTDGKALQVRFSGCKNIESVEIYIIFDDDDTSAALRAFGFCKVPEEKRAAIYKACSDMNRKFRWVKFYLNKDKGSLNAEDDAKFEPETCGPEIFELVLRMTGIVDQAYPEFMKALWS